MCYNFLFQRISKPQEMRPSESGKKLYLAINKAIEDSQITRNEYDNILHLASEDGVIDSQEKVLLEQLQDMIHTGVVKMVHK